MQLEFVVILGLSIVFVGLICLIYISKIMSSVCKLLDKIQKNTSVNTAQPTKQTAAPRAVSPPPTPKNRPEFIAAISAAIAYDMGIDVSGLRIHSIKKL